MSRVSDVTCHSQTPTYIHRYIHAYTHTSVMCDVTFSSPSFVLRPLCTCYTHTVTHTVFLFLALCICNIMHAMHTVFLLEEYPISHTMYLEYYAHYVAMTRTTTRCSYYAYDVEWRYLWRLRYISCYVFAYAFILRAFILRYCVFYFLEFSTAEEHVHIHTYI